MRKFIVNVNGTSYEVEVEEIAPGSNSVPASKPATVSAASSGPAAPAKGSAVLSGNEKTINAPMPGSILSVNVKEGDTFRSGQVLIVLEAMKMENEIMAPTDGKVVSVSTRAGATVNSGEVLIAYV